MPPAAPITRVQKVVVAAGYSHVIDVAGLVYIPADLGSEPCLSLRLLHFPIGRTVRVPNQVGMLVCSKPWNYSLAPCLFIHNSFRIEASLSDLLRGLLPNAHDEHDGIVHYGA